MELTGKQRAQLCAVFGSYMYKALGKGPRDIRIVTKPSQIEFKVSGIFTQLEKSYCQINKDASTIHKLREEILQASFEMFKNSVAEICGLELTGISSETECESETRTIIFKVK